MSVGNIGFITKHQKEYGSEPGPFAAQAYDAYRALAEALKAGATTGEQIKEKLAAVEFDGASGHIKFDVNGDVSGNYDLYVVEEGKWVPG